MGNYCSSGQNKKDKDNLSQKSEDSPTYQLASKGRKFNKKEAPLVDPEPTSDISNFNTSTVYPPNSNGNVSKTDTSGADVTKAPLKSILGIHSTTHDSTSSSPLALNAPCDLPATGVTASTSSHQILPTNLAPIYGTPTQNRRTENERKIVLYILAADDVHKDEKNLLSGMYQELKEYSACRGFELQISDAHEQSYNFLDPKCWIDEPLEARGGHHLAAQCLSEIARHSNQAYIVPVLFLGTTLGCPLLPLTIESQDFVSAFSTTAQGSDERQLLERWYILDDKAEPPCYRLKTTDILANDETATDLQQLYKSLVDVFSKELRDSYLTTVIEQEINNTVLISHELSKRCIWIHTGVLPSKGPDAGGAESVAGEMNRRLNNLQMELKNQLCEKNLIRIPPSVQVPLAASLKSLLIANIDSICDDHAAKLHIPYCTYGVDRNLLAEIEAVNQNSNLLSQNCANFVIMDRIKQYVTTPSSKEPLIVFGPTGCGKSALSAKIAQIIHTWLPDCCFVIRYTGLTPLSTDLTSLIGSIAEQVSYFTKKEPFTESHTIQNYANAISSCIAETKYQFVILIDSLDEALHLNDFDWLPTQLNDKVKIIATISSNIQNVNDCTSEDNRVLFMLKNKLAATSFVHLNQFSEQQWNEVLSCGGGNFYSANAHLQVPDSWKSCDEKIPLKAKLLWWFAWLGETDLTDISLTSICDKVFDIIETKFGKDVTKFVLSLLCASREGVSETEVIELLNDSQLVADSVPKFWMHFCWILGRGPIFRQSNRLTLMDNKLKCIALKRYTDDVKLAHNILHNYYTRQPDIFGDDNGSKYQWINVNKFIELPYHAHILKQSIAESIYVTDLHWIQTKLRATKCVQCILNDIHLISEKSRINSKPLDTLKQFLEINIRPINYDANQFYQLFKHFIKTKVADDAVLTQNATYQRWLSAFESIPISYLDIIDQKVSDATSRDAQKLAVGYDVIANLGGDGYFVASLSTKREEICVWNVPSCTKVRTLIGIPQPTALCPVGDYGAAVLCCREIKIIDLNKGVFRVTLKGVMNQKMPYFAYCNDAQHLVCLSRNRMYVNLMNLESGDCITTFKAGEDRFLNSLLVSGDGRILVCGDETQKPFPLLVWHLSQRKLLYDLRIPHHDFLTSLSAITHEGSYVCVVAKELNEPAPNFIVVYDLQSGTLFKKWKPSCNTVSLSISQANACVIAGLEDARILIWDLITGNCKYVLVGHTAPVTLLKLDPNGAILLSSDKEGRDRSVRLWELSTGKSIAVHTPPKKITTCEILPLGKYIVLALENEPNLVTLELKNCVTSNRNNHPTADAAVDAAVDDDDATENAKFTFGDEDLNGKTIQL